ncbi:MAG: 4-hydroxy-tetrahydrodipicolinate reductase [Candidatus Omnitrophota bacterium]
MNNLAITGCQGRMGRRIVAQAIMDGYFEIAALIERPGCVDGSGTMNGIPIQTSISAIEGCDVLIDFTAPESTMENVRFCKRHGIRIVIGTTGLSPEQEQEIRKASETIPIVLSSNMSVGVNILFKATELLAQATTPEYSVRIVEAHHIHKKDAPSGTAKTLANLIKAASAKEVQDIESIREGEIIGDHDVLFSSDEDIITIRHHAKSRDIFAKGAIVAAKFLMKETSGLFSMQDVLKLNF